MFTEMFRQVPVWRFTSSRLKAEEERKKTLRLQQILANIAVLDDV